MKTKLIAFVSVAVAFAANAVTVDVAESESEAVKTTAENTAPQPLLAGFHPDPSVCAGPDGAYYLTTSTFMWQPGLPVYRSEDFKKWSLAGHVVADFSRLLRKGEDSLNDDDGVWAPTLRFYEGTWYAVFTFHGKTSRNYICTAKDVAGPWSAPLHVKEADGGIDPSLFFDDDGKVYWLAERTAKPHLWRGHTEIYIAEIDLTTGRFKTDPKPVSSGVFPNAKNTEGPHLYKIDGTYLLIHAEGGTSFDHAATAMTSVNVFGPYAPQKNNPLITRRDRGEDSPLQATGHADIVKAPGENEYFAVFLGKRPIGADHRVILGRETFACKAQWLNGELVFDGENLIAGSVATPEEECFVEDNANGRSFAVRRVRDFAFDETMDAEIGDGLVVWRSAQGYILIERRADGTHLIVSDKAGANEKSVAQTDAIGKIRLRFVCEDGLTVKAFVGNELLGEISTASVAHDGRHTRFNGLGIGRKKEKIHGAPSKARQN